jgi:hypothetical protein
MWWYPKGKSHFALPLLVIFFFTSYNFAGAAANCRPTRRAKPRPRTCGQPQVRKTTFQSHPPLIAFQWGGAPPILHTSLHITCRGVAEQYILRGVIYYANQHFTTHFLDSTGGCWYHDGMTRNGALILQRPSQAQLATAIAAVYTLHV